MRGGVHMKTAHLTFVIFLLAASLSAASARQDKSDQFLKAIQVTPGTPQDDRPIQVGFEKARADTIWYGGHDGNGYAVEGGIWDFEDGMGGPDWQGWYGVDEWENTFVVGYRVSADDFDCPNDAPIIHRGQGNVGQIWFGAHGYILDPNEQPREVSGDGGCWVCDAGGDCSDPATRVGYADNWCQQATSPQLVYDEETMGDIAVDFLYFLDCEGFPFDFTRVQIVSYTAGEEEETDLITNIDDGAGGIIGDPVNPATFHGGLGESQLPGDTEAIALRFEFTSDGGWSDEDAGGGVCSTYGPFGVDNVSLSIAGGDTVTYDFEEGDQDWTFTPCPGIGNFVDLHHVSEYEILDPCDCGLEGWIMAFHDENFEHPGDWDGSLTGQANMAVSAIVDRTAHPSDDGWNDIFWRLDIYAWLPLYNGVLYRPGMFYYPWECTETGIGGWSPRTGQEVWFYVGTDPVCFESFNNFVVDGVPGNADLYRGTFQLLSCCTCFGLGEEDCTGITNETPLIDNIRVGLTQIPDTPVIGLDTFRFIDAFAEDGTQSPTSTGRSDDPAIPAGNDPPIVLSDSLGISGPVVGGGAADPWEAHLWFRIARKGPMQDNLPYSSWKTRLSSASFPGDPEVEFVGIKMDSSQLGSSAFSNKFCSFAHPDDGFYQGDPEADERSDLNEILPDYAFTPGTQIEYFITGRFIGQTEMHFLPDTSGGFFFEYEILPSMRWAGEPGESDIVWPCILYWDAYNRGAQPFIEAALEMIVPPVPGDGPNHDRFDHFGSASGFGGASIYRPGPGREGGGTLVQLLGYKVIILNTGDFGRGVLNEIDMIGVEDWLGATVCDGAINRQGFIANGDKVAAVIEQHGMSVLTGTLGAGIDCSPYREPNCPAGTPSDSSFCVSLIEPSGAAYPPLGSYYALGNGCPNTFTFSVLFPTGGIGNRNWWDYDGGPGGKGVVSFAQVVNDQSGETGNFRSVVDGYSYHHITTTFNPETEECEVDFDGRVEAAANEISAALDWIFDGEVPTYCTPCPDPSDAPDVGSTVAVKVNRLYQNEPNPFNPRTAIRFSVATRGTVELSIYDVGGRLVNTLVDRPMDAGLHNVVWDGTDSEGHKVGSGIYWSQLKVGDYISNKKMVLLK
jgi:hypothetical protein